MQAIDARTQVAYMSSWGTASVVDVLTMKGRQVGQITNGLAEPQGLFVDAKGSLWVQTGATSWCIHAAVYLRARRSRIRLVLQPT